MDQQLLAFVTVADCRNFTRAAEILHTTQPAISQHIQNLERRMNVKLLERTNKYVRLNKVGTVVYHYAREILDLYTQMDRMVSDMINEVGGMLSIGASLTFGEYVLPHLLTSFLKMYPNVTPKISIENTQIVVDQVSDGRIDIGIIEGHNSHHDVFVQAFAEDTVVIVGPSSHSLVSKAKVSAERLSQENWIVRENGSGTREIANHMFHTFGILPASLMEFGSTQVIKESVEAGLGITILSKSVIRKELSLQLLAEIPFSEEPIHRQFSIVTRKTDFQTKAAQLFAKFLCEESPKFVLDI